ncbi:MAG: SDR family NAD(P)-dependent oxidoreductase [Deltaproteobacteria bacterium]|nr:SDR family NAD(P)-dependent oxidoreductase [Deltaproteobacteria bacterium]MBW2361718.1 SDR family NAD(P)-dependent oxidoreductase [Deltaproteobacteria bacterium]
MEQLEGKVAVVTGGAGGIGKAIGEAFLAEGMKVVLADIVKAPLDEAVSDIGSDDLIGVVTDVASYDSLCATRDAAIDRFGAVHVLCNNAAIGAGATGHIWEHHINDWEWSMDVNVLGIINGLNAFVPTLIAQDEGHVVNTSSGNGGFTPMAATGIYPVTKAAVVTITECLWGQLRDLGSRVSTSILFPSTRSPGVMATGIWNAGANRPERYFRGTPEADSGGQDALQDYLDRARKAGQEVPIAPLSEVAELCVDSIRRDNFWATVPTERQTNLLHARLKSQLEQTPPDYLIEENLMAKSASERDAE